MTDGNLELLQIVVSWAVTLPMVVAIIVGDTRRLPDEQLARTWPDVSRDAAIFGLWNLGVHPLCLVIHFTRTRRTIAGFGVGLLWLQLVLFADLGAQLAVTALVHRLGR